MFLPSQIVSARHVAQPRTNVPRWVRTSMIVTSVIVFALQRLVYTSIGPQQPAEHVRRAQALRSDKDDVPRKKPKKDKHDDNGQPRRQAVSLERTALSARLVLPH